MSEAPPDEGTDDDTEDPRQRAQRFIGTADEVQITRAGS